MSHYGIFFVTPTSEDWIPGYLAAVGPLIEKHGGRFLARTASHERLEGTSVAPALIAILEFPSKEASESFYNDPAYQPHREARLAGADNHFFVVEGKDDFG